MKTLTLILLLLISLSAPAMAQMTNPDIEFDHVTYLTDKFDSVMSAYQRSGFKITAGARESFGVQSDFVWFPDGSYIEIQTTTTDDSTNWRRRAIRSFGTHVAALAFRVKNLDTVRAALSGNGVQIGTVSSGKVQCPDLGRELKWRSCALVGPAPLDVVFVESERVAPPEKISKHPGGVYRVNWLLLTASPDEEKLLRKAFDALHIHRSHAGCCDYWMLGPVERRVGIRFQLPQDTYKPLDNWLEIDNGGVIFAY